jgi:hypothetical protein
MKPQAAAAKEAANKAERIYKVARAAFFDAIDIHSCIEMLGASNQPDVLRSLKDAKADHAADLIQKALFGRLIIEVMTAFGPKRSAGDFHLKFGMDLIREPIPREVILQKGGKLDDIQAAQRRWAECLKFKPYERLRTYRNKFVAHLSDPPAGMKDPIIFELFELARMTADVAEFFAHGTGIATLSLKSQVIPFRDSSRAFWGRWKR